MGRLRDLDDRFERSLATTRWDRWVMPALFAVIAVAAVVGGLLAGRGVLFALIAALAVAGGPWLGVRHGLRRPRSPGGR